jgi:predicted metalloprotease with PDZ domain
MVRDVMGDLIEFGQVRRGWLGVTLQDLSQELRSQFGIPAGVTGVVVSDVLPDTPAQRAGLERGDVITAMDGEAVVSVVSFRNRIAAADPETRVTLQLVRGGRERRVQVVLGAQETAPGEDTAAPETLDGHQGEWLMEELDGTGRSTWSTRSERSTDRGRNLAGSAGRAGLIPET